MKQGILNYVPREEVFRIQLRYLEDKWKQERIKVLQEKLDDKKLS